MSERRRHVHAFTLIELLVVVAILALLVLALVPMLSGARELARRVKCMAQFRHIAIAFNGFAAMHQGRGPGSAYVFYSNDPAQWIPQTAYIQRSMGWKGMLDRDYFRIGDNAPSMFPIWLPMTTNLPPGTSPKYSSDLQTRSKQLACPSARVSASNYCLREYCVFVDFEGGPRVGNISDAVEPIEGPYGAKMRPAPPPWTVYCLGPMYEKYPWPNQQFALWESEWATDNTWQANNLDGSTGPVNDVGTLAKPYLGHNGQYAFRHTLPADPTQVTQKATANFLFFDGHVEYLGPRAKIAGRDRYAYKPD